MAAPVANSSSADCECTPPPPPPPDFRVPPPPRPPFLASRENLQESGKDCLDRPALVLEVGSCTAVPLVDPEFRSSPALPSIAVIVVCALLLLAMLMMASVLIWKHKRKVQNFLPCKASPQSRCDGVAVANGVIYEDLTNIRPRPPPPHCPVVQLGGPPAPLELIDVMSASVKYGEGHPSVFICPPPTLAPLEHIYSSYLPTAREGQHLRGEATSDHHVHRNSKDLYNPVYEELSNGSEREAAGSDPGSDGRRRRRTVRRGAVEAPGASEDEFAEDELSDRAGGDSSSSSCSDPECRRLRVQTDAVPRAPHGPGPPRHHANTTTRPRRPPPRTTSSAERRRAPPWRRDAPCRPLPPSSSSSSSAASSYCPTSALLPPPPPGAPRLICLPPSGASLRSSRDSFGSDSGFSNNTSGGVASCRVMAVPSHGRATAATKKDLPSFFEPGGASVPT